MELCEPTRYGQFTVQFDPQLERSYQLTLRSQPGQLWEGPLAMTLIERMGFAWYLRRIAHITTMRGGVTTDVQARQVLAPRDVWYFPKYPHRTVMLPCDARLVPALRHFVRANDGYLCEPESWLGTWLHPVTRYVYIDITTCCATFGEACARALELGNRAQRPIIALYNAEREQIVYLRAIPPC